MAVGYPGERTEGRFPEKNMTPQDPDSRRYQDGADRGLAFGVFSLIIAISACNIIENFVNNNITFKELVDYFF